jgi:DNA-binding CsgD family transcriptional regulator
VASTIYVGLVSDDDQPRAKLVLARTLLGGEASADDRLTILDADGRPVRVRAWSFPVRGGSHTAARLTLLQVVAADRAAVEAPRLTPRQHELLRLLAHGRSTDEIAAELTIAADTVRNHVRRLLRRLGARTRLEAVARAREHGLL